MSLATIPVDAPFEEFAAAVRRDGGVIIKDFLSTEELAAMTAEGEPFFEGKEPTITDKNPDDASNAMGKDFFSSNTTHVSGLLGKMPLSMAGVVRHPLWIGLMEEFLGGVMTGWAGNQWLENKTSFCVNLVAAFKVGPGATDQLLHRDSSVHALQIPNEASLYNTICGFLIAGTDATKRNGATRVIPGSHLWGVYRQPKPEEAVSAEMSAGSALFWLGNTYHGAGANTASLQDSDAWRVLYGVFGCRDTIRSEENQILAIPPEVAATLPDDVLARAGWQAASSGCGYAHENELFARVNAVFGNRKSKYGKQTGGISLGTQVATVAAPSA